MILYLRDLFAALWAWCSIWNMDKERLERRLRFIDDGIEPERKKQFPYRILVAAYRRKLKHK